MEERVFKWGWRPDKPDARDRTLAIERQVALPTSVDLRGPRMPQVYDQSKLGSCTANATAAAVDYERAFQGESFVTPSRLFIYFNERTMEGTVSEDSGASLRDGIKSVAKLGVCPESQWPYDIDKFADAPTKDCYAAAVKIEALQYSRVTQNAYHTKHCLAILRRPFVFGFSVYDSFQTHEVAGTGVVPMPGPDESVLGGHAVVAVGYDDVKQTYLVRNSWGSGWGQAGYFVMPYAYLLNPNLANDLWVVLKES